MYTLDAAIGFINHLITKAPWGDSNFRLSQRPGKLIPRSQVDTMIGSEANFEIINYEKDIHLSIAGKTRWLQVAKQIHIGL